MFTFCAEVVEVLLPEPDAPGFFRRKQRAKSLPHFKALAGAKAPSIYTSGFV